MNFSKYTIDELKRAVEHVKNRSPKIEHGRVEHTEKLDEIKDRSGRRYSVIDVNPVENPAGDVPLYGENRNYRQRIKQW